MMRNIVKINKKFTFFILLLLSFMLVGCASTPEKSGYSHKQQLQKDKEQQGFLIRAVATAVGAIAGGAVGIMSAEQNAALTMGITGVALGGAVGFGLGWVVSENFAKSQEDEVHKPEDKKIEEYWQEYEYLKLKN